MTYASWKRRSWKPARFPLSFSSLAASGQLIADQPRTAAPWAAPLACAALDARAGAQAGACPAARATPRPPSPPGAPNACARDLCAHGHGASENSAGLESDGAGSIPSGQRGGGIAAQAGRAGA